MTSATGPRTDRRAPGGFTLLELIAVLVLISTVLAIAAPSLRGFVHGRQTTDTAARMLALTRLARSQAISRGAVHRLNIDAETGVYWLTMQEGGAFVETTADRRRHYRLPAGVSVAVEEPQSESEGSAWYVEFHPDGRCDPTTIELTGSEGDVLRIRCLSPSEGFRVVSPAEDERL
jgi:type II secretion system protein H